MSTWVVTRVVCDHGSHSDAEAEVVLSYGFPEGEDPAINKGFWNFGGRLLDSSNTRIDTSGATNRFRAVWDFAVETRELPRVIHEVSCPLPECTITARVTEIGLRRALKLAYGQNVSDLPLSTIERIVALSS